MLVNSRADLRKNIEQNLIERAAAGNSEAFRELFDSLKDPIYGFAFRMTEKASIAEEITQEVFIFFIENPDKYKPEKGTLFSFLCGVARNKILNHLKKSGTRLEASSFETEQFENFPNSVGITPIRDLLNREFSEKIEESVAELSPLQREVLLLREVEDLSYQEIAIITGAEVGAIKGRLFRARRALAVKLAPYIKSEKVDAYELHRS